MEADDHQTLEQSDNRSKSNSFGFYLAGVTGGIALLLSVVSGSFVTPALRKVNIKLLSQISIKFPYIIFRLIPVTIFDKYIL